MKDHDPRQTWKPVVGYLAIVALIMLLSNIFIFPTILKTDREISYSDLMEKLDNQGGEEKITAVSLNEDNRTLRMLDRKRVA